MYALQHMEVCSLHCSYTHTHSLAVAQFTVPPIVTRHTVTDTAGTLTVATASLVLNVLKGINQCVFTCALYTCADACTCIKSVYMLSLRCCTT